MLDWILLDFTGFYWVLHAFTGLYSIRPGFLETTLVIRWFDPIRFLFYWI